jgi:hypothetical protein
MPRATSVIAARGDGGSWGHQKFTPGWCRATYAAICRALADWGEERKPCRYRRWVVVMEGENDRAGESLLQRAVAGT